MRAPCFGSIATIADHGSISIVTTLEDVYEQQVATLTRQVAELQRSLADETHRRMELEQICQALHTQLKEAEAKHERLLLGLVGTHEA